MHITENDVFEEARQTFMDTLMDACYRALHEGIEANTVIINKNMVKVKSFLMREPDGGAGIMPDMICGLNVLWTDKELPPGYSFAIFEGPKNRLARFESIGMEPDELRKAAELYRTIKEVMK